MESLYSSFCKVEFLCYQGEPNWLGWLVLIPFFLILTIFLYNLLVGETIKINDWLDDIKSESEKENSTFKDKIKHLLAIVLYLVYIIFIFSLGYLIVDWIFEVEVLES